MSKPVVRVYTDYKSPYAFIAVKPTYELAEALDLELEWLPYTLRISEYLGSVEERTEHSWRRVRYSYMDARRYANKQGLTLKGPKRVYDGYYASAGMVFAQRTGIFRPYHDTVFETFWKRELDIDVLSEVSALIGSVGGDPAAFEAYAEGPGRAEQDAIVTEAEAMGVFGVPTFVFEGELFWGGDRIDLLRERIAESRAAAASE
ncbi:DsbA family protein [Thalassobaculum sp.]|uniref:2-hydroxychromene-2-carboxylate isomerase n=1 Tax=Thalassobaculum sp. TaxID=2022740 RepID=UPI0032F04339